MVIRIVKAEYDAQRNELRLLEPLEGFADGAKVEITVVKTDPSRWADLSGIISGEAGDSFARAIDELFPDDEG